VRYYPALVNLKNKKAVVVGGGRVAERKVRHLIDAGAYVKVVSPAITGYLRKLADNGLLEHIQRNYRKGDLNNAFVAIAATSSTVLNTQIAREAKHLVNVIDMPSEGNYIVPSIVRRGPLTIAVSTEGASPAISKTIRKEIEERYGKEFALYLRHVEAVRKRAMEKILSEKKREKFLKSLASDEVIVTLRTKGFRAAQKIISSSLDNAIND